MLKGMVALITGGAGCLGSATAKKMVADGMKVMLLDLPNSDGQKFADELGSSAAFCAGSIISEEDVCNALETAKSKFGKLNVVVNCAGTFMARVVFNFNKSRPMSFEDYSNFINLNLGGTLNVNRLAVQYLQDNKPDEDGLRGLIINTAGFADVDGQKGQVVLAAVWGGISSMTVPLCREFGQVGIRVVTISPGLIKSNVMNQMPKRVLDHLEVLTPSPKRMGKPEEYAHMVMTTIENPFINGQVLRLDGGLRFTLV